MTRFPMFALIGIFLASPALAQAPQTECDRIASHPSDTQNPAVGVAHEDYDIPAGRAACREALDAYPDEARFYYQYGRSFFYEDDYDTALPLFRRAAEGGYGQGQMVYGLVLMMGYGGEPDECEAGKWWLAGARQQHLYTKVYLLQNWMDGLFDDCGLDLTEEEASKMVDDAAALATTQQARDDVAQLKESWAQR